MEEATPSFIKPPRLKAGDTLAAISLSSGLAHHLPHRYEAGKRQLEEALRVRVIEAPHALRSDEWLRQNPEARAHDLHWALSNPEVAGIISTIGGDDSVRILPHLDADMIRANPKVLMGFSDTTITLTAFLNAGVMAFHGPAIMTEFAENLGIAPFVIDSVQRVLFGAEPAPWEASAVWTEEFLDWAVLKNQGTPRKWQSNPGHTWLGGEAAAEGHVIGGNIEVLEFIKGTPYWPPRALWRGAVFLIETSE